MKRTVSCVVCGAEIAREGRPSRARQWTARHVGVCDAHLDRAIVWVREPELIDQLFASLKGRSVCAAYEDIEQPASSDRALLLALDDGSWLRFFPCSQSLLCGVLLLSAEGHLREGPKGMVPLTPNDPKAISWHRALLRAIERRALVRELRNGDLGLELHFDANEVLHLRDQVSAPACYESWFSWTGAPIHLPDPADVVRRGAPRTRDRSRVR